MSSSTSASNNDGGGAAAWRDAHVVTVHAEPVASRVNLNALYDAADALRAKVESGEALTCCAGRVAALVFFEPSTRTRCSFEAAMYRLGGKVLAIDAKTSSNKKGETLEDTLRCLECYCDVMVMRHPEIGSSKRGAAVLKRPLLNAGDGAGEHPTQSLLDVYTMLRERSSQSLEGAVVTIVGDLKYGRTVHSLVHVLRLYGVAKLNFVAPQGLEMPSKVVDTLPMPFSSHETLSDDVLAETDVMYVTRIQKERFEDPSLYEKVAGSFVIDNATMTKCKSTCVVMHPLPRVGEIKEEVDADPRAAYFRQMKNGMFVRMALLALALGVNVK